MNIASASHDFNATHHWISRFAVRLMARCHDVSFRAAVARAVTVHAHANDLTPEDAAEMDAEVRMLRASRSQRAAVGDPPPSLIDRRPGGRSRPTETAPARSR